MSKILGIGWLLYAIAIMLSGGEFAPSYVIVAIMALLLAMYNFSDANERG